MKLVKTLLLLLGFFISRAQNNVTFKHLNVENGLSQSSVLAITQDSKGFIWFGTRFGLNKYDSRDFKIYVNEKGDNKSLSHSEYISALLPSRDGKLWVGTPSGLNKYNEATDNFDHILYRENDQNSISNSKINCIYQDRKNRLWVGTANGLNLLVSEKGYRFKRFFYKKGEIQQVYAIFEDSNNKIWLSTSRGLFNMVIENRQTKIKYFKDFSEQLNKALDNHVTTFAEDGEHNLWIGTKQTGLNKLVLKTETITTYTYSSLNLSGISSNNIRKIIADREGKLWIGTLHGINIYNSATKTFTNIQNEPGNRESLSQNSVYDIFQDKQGIIWVGTYYGGVNIVYPNYTPFKVYRSSETNKGLSSSVVSAITEDTDHNLWIGTEGEGLNYFNRKNQTYIHYKYDPNNPRSLSSNLVKSIIKDKKNRIWIGTHLGGLNLFNPQTKTFTRFTSKRNDTSSLSNDEITAIFEDSKGRFWVGTNNGLNSFNSETGKFIRNRIKAVASAIQFIFEDARHNVWVAANSGLYQLKDGANVFTSREADNPSSLPYNDVSCIAEDESGNIWLGTFRNGLFRLDTQKHSYVQVTKSDGLPSNNIVGILEDEQHNLWISTDNGLCRYYQQKKAFKVYNVKDGLPGNEFNYKSLLKDSKGEFYFGSLSGMVSFFPKDIRENKSIPTAIFTGLKLFNKPVDLNADHNLLDSNISVTKSITFKSSENVFSIGFTVLNFIKPNKNLYAYKLVGFENNWNYVNIPSASYTNLSPGTYTLLVKGSNNDGFWTKTPSAMKIKVLPPFYQTWWAYLIYLCFTAAILFLVIRYLLIRAVLTKEKEISEHKLQFFTNISHEIRTPLTLITGPLEKIIDKFQNDTELRNNLQPIKHNADRLMNLVTELLDFRKAESGKMQLKISPGNMVKFCREIFLVFEGIALTKGITYTFEAAEEEIEIYFDKVQMEKVMFNLLSNAFKFCPVNGNVDFRITANDNEIHIKICDNGKGIPKEAKANLFQDFYQVEPSTNIGTGLGLSLSKSIAELHHGSIRVESEEETEGKRGFTCFTVNLKKGNKHFKAEDFISDYLYYDDAANYSLQTGLNYLAEEEKSLPVTNEKKFTVLIIEDNTEIRNFIESSLADTYKVYKCENGLQGWETAIELIPDLILSDVMMPEMDGLELCRKLKTDLRTSHIPVVLLTARSAYVHQINGLENGADAYVMKPFNVKILLLNIHNLLTARETIKKKYAQVIKLEPKDFVVNKTEQDFLANIIRIIEEHMADPEFGVPFLASEIGMSRSVLYKKMRALTDLSVNDFIKSIRLKRAAILLLQNFGNVSEIAYTVGFSDRKYFSIEFKKQFGKSPTEFVNKEN